MFLLPLTLFPRPPVLQLPSWPTRTPRPLMETDDRAYALARLREGAEGWLGLCCAISLTEGSGLQPFAAPRGWLAEVSPPPAQAYTQSELVAEIERREPALYALLDACAARAPALCTPHALLPLARLAAWTTEWVRPLEEWEGVPAARTERVALRSLAGHLLERWAVPPALHGGLEYRDGPPVSEAAQRVARAFVKVHASVGAGGGSVLQGLRESVSPATTKAAAKEFVKMGDESADNPLLALRKSQVRSLSGAQFVVEGTCQSRLGSSFAKSEAFALAAMQWVVRHQDALAEQYMVRAVLDFFLEMHQLDEEYSCAGRTPKTVREALEAYTASSITFEDDEQFEPNPRGLRGMFELSATIPQGTRVYVPYDGRYELGGNGQPGQRAATVRIAEILSLRRLFFEGEQLSNCLEDSRRSQGKYLSRARARVSSFWSLTKQEPEAAVKHLCLIEVWHLADSNIIRQAEGPRPRTLPSAEAWYWMARWCERENIDLSAWDCYS
ncbi:hypothetical protein AB1Y20_008436 [Prymnesium parvum]|uniref:Uncharacterized protein n=1 Tax=Prymnesium parvum TaxID=97485 RepID=A0AB34IT84_PRYPA